jgi:hypothetical protein
MRKRPLGPAADQQRTCSEMSIAEREWAEKREEEKKSGKE